MQHYVCTGGCNGMSEDPAATCQAADCPNHTHPLTPCTCEDGQHTAVLEAAAAAGEVTTE